MKRVYDKEVNDCHLVIAETGETFTGIIRQGNSEKFRQSHENLEVLKAVLLNEAGKLHPNYIGIDGAIKRFKQFFPLGFDDPYYRFTERDYKDKKRETLRALFEAMETLESNTDANVPKSVVASTLASKVTINLLSTFENARLHEILSQKPDDQYPEYLMASKKLLKDDLQNKSKIDAQLKRIAQTIKPFGSVTWPLVTILPYFWNPEEHMFLKPVATKDYADRVGHGFSTLYSSGINAETYFSLLDLANWTHGKIGSLNPKDRIDVQSFIWVVGNYKDSDLEDAEKFRKKNT